MIDRLFIGSVDALNPTPEQVNVGPMLDNLSRVIRWNGGGELSVLQHMMHVALILHQAGETKTTALAGLVHDLHEYVTGDIPAPLLTGLWFDTGAELVRVTDMQRRIQAAIERRLGVDLTGADLDAVDRADKQARAQEQVLFHTGALPDWIKQIASLSRIQAVAKYRRGLEQLGVIL